MRPKTTPFQPTETKEERETKIKEFILKALDDSVPGRDDAIAVLACSPASPVVKALLSLSEDLARRGVGALIILAGGATAVEGETWSISFSQGFAHEIRLTSNPRILDGHEQLVVGGSAVWYGDNMRRDPWKRDAFALFMANQPVAAGRGRTTFQRVWAGAQSIYRNKALSSVVVTANDVDVRRIAAEMPASPATPASSDSATAAPPAASISDTLEAWQPSTRH